MPELPEVETVRRGLAPAMEGRRIAEVTVRRRRLRRELPDDFEARLEGRRVLGLGRRGKYLLGRLEGGDVWLAHLGMSGRLVIETDAARRKPGEFHHRAPAARRHDHVILAMEDGTRVIFNDPRRFGLMDVVAGEALDRHPLLRDMGPEPLGNEFSPAFLLARCRGRHRAIKEILLDQKTVAGIGNIYACEALWRARIHPLLPGTGLDMAMAAALVGAIRDVLAEAIAAGGSSLRDYRKADGRLGYFQHAFRVYDREGAPCSRQECSGKIERIRQGGRSSFLCPLCQVLPANP